MVTYAKQPNIVFLMTDDQRWDCFGAYGRPEFETHHLDQLAKQGVVFDRAYHTVAICMPSRATVFSGRYFYNHQVGFTPPYNFTYSHNDFDKSYPAQLKKAGYRTGFIGKFGFAVTEEAYQTKGAVTKYSYEEHVKRYFDFFAAQGVHVKTPTELWPVDSRLKEIYSKTRPENERTLKTGDAMIHFLETHNTEQPFCLSVSFFAVKNDKDKDMYPEHKKKFESVNFSPPENWVEGKNENLPEVLDNWRGVGLHRARTSTIGLYQKINRRFAAQGYTVDLQVGRLVKKLEEMGQLDNTIIIYTSDNGRFHGSHGLYDKAIHYNESMKAPLIIFDGRLQDDLRGRRIDSLVSMVDIAPTILSMAGVNQPEMMQGRDFSKMIEGTQGDAVHREYVYNESLFLSALHQARNDPKVNEINESLIANNKSYRCRGLTSKRYKYFIYYEHDPVIEELYDQIADPQEMNNLVNDMRYKSVLEKMRADTVHYHETIRKK